MKQFLQKSKENHIDQEIHFDPAYDISDPDLIQAARLGKHALRDQRMMIFFGINFKIKIKLPLFLASTVHR